MYSCMYKEHVEGQMVYVGEQTVDELMYNIFYVKKFISIFVTRFSLITTISYFKMKKNRW